MTNQTTLPPIGSYVRAVQILNLTGIPNGEQYIGAMGAVIDNSVNYPELGRIICRFSDRTELYVHDWEPWTDPDASDIGLKTASAVLAEADDKHLQSLKRDLKRAEAILFLSECTNADCQENVDRVLAQIADYRDLRLKGVGNAQ